MAQEVRPEMGRRYFDGFNNEVTSYVEGLEAESKVIAQLIKEQSAEVEALKRELASLKKKAGKT